MWVKVKRRGQTMCRSTWSRGRTECVYEGTRHGGRVGGVGGTAWLSETGAERAREDNAEQKWTAMVSADGCAFMKLYRKLRCRACTASLGVEEPRCPSSVAPVSSSTVWPRPPLCRG
jgi:hypothetical protein